MVVVMDKVLHGHQLLVIQALEVEVVVVTMVTDQVLGVEVVVRV